MLALVLALAVSAPAAPPGSAPAPAADDTKAALIAACIEAHGGKRAVVRLARSRAEGRVTSLLHPGEQGRLVRIYERSGRLRVLVEFPGSPPELRILDGGRGWRHGVPVEGPLLASMMLQAARLDLPALLAAWEAKVEDRGTFAEGALRLRVLALEVAPGLVVEAGIDPGSGRILRSRGTAAGPVPLEFVTVYSDFRSVDGVLVAFREENHANGRITGETILETVELPGRIAETLFRP